jgi:hypothetical protein
MRLRNKKMLLLLIEAYIYLAWSRILLLRPFSKIASKLGFQMQETTNTRDQANKVILQQISIAIYRMSRHTFWESKCLVRAIAAMKMLQRRRIESTLYLGTTKDADGGMIAHAWLRSGTFYITGAKEMRKYTVVGKFAKRID